MSAEVAVDTGRPAAVGRDPYVDFLRGFSLLVVVVWHWVFSIIVWRPDGPHTSNPIGTTRGLWALTWLLQVMPLFFVVGGRVHAAAWPKVRAAGGGPLAFYRKRLGRLGVPSGILLGVALVARVALHAVLPHVAWIDRGLVLAVSPLWFLVVYVMLVLLVPVTWWLHEQGGEVVLVAGLCVAAWVDVARFHLHVRGVEWLNLVVVWGLAHQLGYFYQRLVAATSRPGGRRVAWSFAVGGFGALVAFTNIGLYPRSMVGVSAERISNMGPPTLPIVGLCAFQLGVALLLRERVTAWLVRPGPERMVARLNGMAMTVFLWHFPGYAIAYGLLRVAGFHTPEVTSAWWWAQRPIWAVAPAAVTIPIVLFMARFDRPRAGRAARTSS